MSLDHATVRRIARLARIGVDEARVEQLRGELNGILGWIDQLNAVDVDGIEPLTGGAQIAMRMREDRVTDGDQAAAILANSPARAGDYFTVPKVVE